MNYWLIKTEPGAYSWFDLVQDKKTIWDGVRNFQARNNLMLMEKGDLAFFYHSRIGKEIVGIATISKSHFSDPTNEKWRAVEVKLNKKLDRPITLAEIKATKELKGMALIKSSRLSVQPVSKEAFEYIVDMSKKKS